MLRVELSDLWLDASFMCALRRHHGHLNVNEWILKWYPTETNVFFPLIRCSFVVSVWQKKRYAKREWMERRPHERERDREEMSILIENVLTYFKLHHTWKIQNENKEKTVIFHHFHVYTPDESILCAVGNGMTWEGINRDHNSTRSFKYEFVFLIREKSFQNYKYRKERKWNYFQENYKEKSVYQLCFWIFIIFRK